MNKDAAIALLENLLERAAEAGGRMYITSREIEAVSVLLGGTGGVMLPAPASATDHTLLLEPVLVDEIDIVADAMLCIDFGTSFSKAFACIDGQGDLPEVIDLPIGTYGGGSHPLVTPSEMLIDGGTIYFGGFARKLFDDSEATNERLIDSMKQYMTLGANVGNLSKIRVDVDKDPDQRFYQRDMLVLYLAHLTRLTEKALEERGLSGNVRRSFAHPAWTDEHRQSNQAEMTTMMSAAIVLARTLGDRLLDNIPTRTARELLDQLKNMKDLPMNLIAEPVREATAAGAGALLGVRENRREAHIIVDIGAGTTDVAGCYCVNNPDWDRPRVFEVEGAAKAIKSAGNVLDNALTRLILEKSGLVEGSAEYRAATSFLNRAKRSFKEQLFDDGRLLAELPTGEFVDIGLEDFIEFPVVRRFTDSLKKLVTDASAAIAGDQSRIVMVATGGGAKLPMIREIAEQGVDCDGRRISFTWREPSPPGLGEVYPDLVKPYPQIAVAVGGALPRLPEQRSSVPLGLSNAPEYEIVYGYN